VEKIGWFGIVFFRESENFEFLERDGDDRVAGSWVLCVLMLRTQRQLTIADTSGSYSSGS